MIKLQDSLVIEAEVAFRKVFGPFHHRDWTVFTTRASCFAIFYPKGFYVLKEKHYCALMQASSDVGSYDWYFSTLDIDSTIGPEPDPFLNYPRRQTDGHWKGTVRTTYAEYINCLKGDASTNALYDATGQWGILITDDDPCLIGGNPEFIRAIHRHYPDLLHDLENFKQHYGDTEWGQRIVCGIDRSYKRG